MTDDANSDELAVFVSSTLRAIAAGIQDAQKTQIKSAHESGVSGFAAPKEVEFDIAVSAKKTGATEGGFKVTVFGIGANAGGKSDDESSTVSRIRFVVPTRFKSTVSNSGDEPTSWKTA